MKKIMIAAAALAMCAAMSVQTLAGNATLTSKTSAQDIEVKAKYSGSVSTPDTYSVDISWGAMEFTYTASGSKQWVPASHTYTDSTSAAWSVSGNSITVTNHSNKAVNAAFTFVKLPTVTDSITGSFSVVSQTLDAGVENEYDAADSVTSTLTLSGALSSDKTTMTKIGTATVTLS